MHLPLQMSISSVLPVGVLPSSDSDEEVTLYLDDLFARPREKPQLLTLLQRVLKADMPRSPNAT